MSVLDTILHKTFDKDETIEDPMTRLLKAEEAGDFTEMVLLYHEVSRRFLQKGEIEKMYVYIRRFDNLVDIWQEIDSAFHRVYNTMNEEFNEKVYDSYDWIELFEENESLYANQIATQVEEMRDALDTLQILQWNLLTMARFCRLFAQFAAFSGCEVLQDYEKIVDLMVKGMYDKLDEAEAEHINQFIAALETFDNSTAPVDARNRIAVPSQADLELCDLYLHEGALFVCMRDLAEYMEYKEDTEENVEGNMEENDPQSAGVEFVAEGLLTGYYMRTRAEEIASIPAVLEEQERIEADYAFVQENPNREEFAARIAEYKKGINFWEG